MAIRDDLTLAAFAVANGFTLGIDRGRAFGPGVFDATGIPHDGLTFERDGVHVWATSRGWRVAKLAGDRFPPPAPGDFHARLLPALRAAIAAGEAPEPEGPEE